MRILASSCGNMWGYSDDEIEGSGLSAGSSTRKPDLVLSKDDSMHGVVVFLVCGRRRLPINEYFRAIAYIVAVSL